jgi:hypothetical protein
MAVVTVGFARTSVTRKGLIMEDDRARAIRWYHDDQGDVNGLAAEFAAVRAPLEQRIAELEAALTNAREVTRRNTNNWDDGCALCRDRHRDNFLVFNAIVAALSSSSTLAAPCTGCNSTPCVCDQLKDHDDELPVKEER